MSSIAGKSERAGDAGDVERLTFEEFGRDEAIAGEPACTSL